MTHDKYKKHKKKYPHVEVRNKKRHDKKSDTHHEIKHLKKELKHLKSHANLDEVRRLEGELLNLRTRLDNLVITNSLPTVVEPLENKAEVRQPTFATTLSMAKERSTIPTEYESGDGKKVWSWTLSKDESIYTWFTLNFPVRIFRIFYYIDVREGQEKDLLGLVRLSIKIRDVNTSYILPLSFDIINQKYQMQSLNLNLDLDRTNLIYVTVQREDDTYMDKIYVTLIDLV